MFLLFLSLYPHGLSSHVTQIALLYTMKKTSSINNPVFTLQDFAKNKAIPQGEDPAVFFPPVWDWSQQFSTKDQTLFNNPMYVGKGVACVQNGEVKTFRRTKVHNTLSFTPFYRSSRSAVVLCVHSLILPPWVYNSHVE